MNPGDYNRAFIRQKRFLKPTNAAGQKDYFWIDSETLWGSLEDLRASEPGFLGGIASEADSVIKLHNWPELSSWDRLLDTHTEDVYWIDGITRPDLNTTKIFAHRYVEGARTAATP